MAEQNIVSVAKIDPNFQDRIEDLQDHASKTAGGIQLGIGTIAWFRPSSQSGDYFDLYLMGVPFSRDSSNGDYLAATADAFNPGTSGDLVASTLQVDYLANMERAYRNRHTMRRPRAVAHTISRMQGLGNSVGPLANLIAHVSEVLRRAKEPPE